VALTDVLSIDLGTSTTAAVLRRADGTTRTVEFDGEPLLPSGVCAVSSGRLATGRDARDLADTHPFEPAPKRRIGSPAPVTLGHRDYAADELVAAVLGRVLDEAGRLIGGLPGRVVLTFPATWGPDRRMVLVEAARRLGVTDPMLLPEPIAAARFINTVHPCAVPVGRTTVVYDLGAGTFDATVLRRTPHGFTQLATEELPDAGGQDIDAAIVAHLTAAGGRLSRDRMLFWDRVRAAKERLSRETATTVKLPTLDRAAPLDGAVPPDGAVPLDGAGAVPLTRRQVEAIARPILERTVAATRAALVAAGPPATRLAAVVMIGGASRIPLAALLLHSAFGVAPVLVDQPDLVVARGAALPGSRPAPVPAEPEDPGRGDPWLSRLARAVTRPSSPRKPGDP
jgi:molecular chaperone DnaK (HSP70)